MDTYQNPFESMADSDIERFSLYIRFRDTRDHIDAFAQAAKLSIVEALKWAAQPAIEACIDYHTKRQFNLLTLDAINIRREAMHATLELSSILKLENLNQDKAWESQPQTKEDQKRANTRRQSANSLLRALSIMSRLLGSSLSTTIKQLLTPKSSPHTPHTPHTPPSPHPLTNPSPHPHTPPSQASTSNQIKPSRIVNGIEIYEPTGPLPEYASSPFSTSPAQLTSRHANQVLSLKRALEDIEAQESRSNPPKFDPQTPISGPKTNENPSISKPNASSQKLQRPRSP